MTIGLNKEELEKLASFGKTPEERAKCLYGGADPDNLWENIENAAGALQRKLVELILKNNDCIAQQLKKAGIHLEN